MTTKETTLEKAAEELKVEGNAFFKGEKFRNAICKYKEATALNPACPAYWSNMAACYEKLCEYKQMEDAARMCIEADRTFMKGYFRLSSALKYQENYTDCIDVLELGLGVEPSNTDLQNIQKNVRRIVQEQQQQQQKQQHNNEKIRTYCKSAEEQYQKGDIKNAMKTLELASELDDAHDPEIENLLCRVKPKFEEIMNMENIHKDGSSQKIAQQYKQSGDEFYRDSKFQQAVVEYTKCIDLLEVTRNDDNDDIASNTESTTSTEQLMLKAYSNRAACNKQMSNYDNMIQDCTMVLQADPNNVKALIRRAQAFQHFKRYTFALQDIQTVLTTIPSDKVGKANHSLCINIQKELNQHISCGDDLSPKVQNLIKDQTDAQDGDITSSPTTDIQRENDGCLDEESRNIDICVVVNEKSKKSSWNKKIKNASNVRISESDNNNTNNNNRCGGNDTFGQRFQKVLDTDKRILISLAVLLIIMNIPYLKFLMYPFMIFSTWVHEMCHGTAALILGGRIQSLHVFTNGSGLAYTTLTNSNTGKRVFVASAGYTGTSVIGGILLLFRKLRLVPKYCIISIGSLMIISVILFIRNFFGIFMVSMMGLILIVTGLFTPVSILGHIYTFLALTLCFNAFTSINYLLRADFGDDSINEDDESAVTSDAHTIENLLHLPYWLWAFLWLIMSIVMCILGLVYAFEGNNNYSNSNSNNNNNNTDGNSDGNNNENNNTVIY